MNNSLPGKYSLLTVIVNRSKAQRVLNYAKVIGIKRYTSLMGHGTVPNAILKMLELGDINKEVLDEVAMTTLEEVIEENIIDEISNINEINNI